MRHPDGKDEEGHQDGHGVDPESEEPQDAQIPDDRDHRAGQRKKRESLRARKHVDEGPGHEEGHAEEQDHTGRPFRDVPDRLGEADDVDIHFFVLEFVAEARLQLACDLKVVELLTRLRVDLDELGGHHGGCEIVRHESPHDPCLEDVLPDDDQPLGGGLKLSGDHVAAGKSSLHDLGKADVGRIEGLHGALVHARQEEDRIRDFLEDLEEFRREDVPLLHPGRDQEAVGPSELLTILEEGLHVRMLEWQLLLEPGVDLDLRHLVAHDQGDQAEYEEHQLPVSKYSTFDCGDYFVHHVFPPKLSVWSEKALLLKVVHPVNAPLTDQEKPVGPYLDRAMRCPAGRGGWPSGSSFRRPCSPGSFRPGPR